MKHIKVQLNCPLVVPFFVSSPELSAEDFLVSLDEDLLELPFDGPLLDDAVELLDEDFSSTEDFLSSLGALFPFIFLLDFDFCSTICLSSVDSSSKLTFNFNRIYLNTLVRLIPDLLIHLIIISKIKTKIP